MSTGIITIMLMITGIITTITVIITIRITITHMSSGASGRARRPRRGLGALPLPIWRESCGEGVTAFSIAPHPTPLTPKSDVSDFGHSFGDQTRAGPTLVAKTGERKQTKPASRELLQ